MSSDLSIDSFRSWDAWESQMPQPLTRSALSLTAIERLRDLHGNNFPHSLVRREVSRLILPQELKDIVEAKGIKWVQDFGRGAKKTWHKTCKFVKKGAKKTKRFLHEHKKEIIIVTIIVVVAVVVTVIAAYVFPEVAGLVKTVFAGGAAAAAGGASASDLSRSSPNSPDSLALKEDFSIRSHLDISPPVVQSPYELPIWGNYEQSQALTCTASYSPLQNTINSQRSSSWSPLSFDFPPPSSSSFPDSEYFNNSQNALHMALSPSSREKLLPSPAPGSLSQQAPIQQFVQLIEQKLQEPKNPNYLDNLLRKNNHISSTQEFVELIEEKLLETYDPNYMTALQSIWNRFMPATVTPPQNNYASTLSSNKPMAPFQEVPLLGFPEQSTIHFHCGISNTFSSIVEGGLCLNDSLNNVYAVQPHLVHGKSLVKGLAFVGLEKANEALSSAGPSLALPLAAELPGLLLDHSQIQRSIDYEAEHLSQIAKNIREKDNPNLKQVHVTFSNGGHVFREALKQLSPEDQDTIVVITLGSTAIIESDLACEVYNVIGDKDWPSKICNGGGKGIEEAKSKANIEIISQTETKIEVGGHYFMQPDYQRRVSALVDEDIATRYDIY